MTRQMQIGHRKRFLELQVRDGVERFNAYEHFPIISIRSLNLIGKVVKKLERALANNLIGNNVEVLAYKL